MTLATGFFRSSEGESLTFTEFTPCKNLVYSDYGVSVFSSSSGATLVYESNAFHLHKVPQSICSDSHRLYILSGDVLTIVDKKSGSVTDLPSSRVVSIASSETSVFCITGQQECCELIADPDYGFILKPVTALGSLKIRSIACGANFLLCLTMDGQVFSQGIGSRGQLGLGDLDDHDVLTPVEALQPVTVVRISAGKWHSACVTDTGDLYTWGWNEHGQLGYGSLALRKKPSTTTKSDLTSCLSVACLPKPVDLPDELDVVEVACGSRHTACLTEKGQLYVFGWNGFGQLGLGSSLEATDTPMSPSFAAHKNKSGRVKSVRCGLWSTMVLLDDE